MLKTRTRRHPGQLKWIYFIYLLIDIVWLPSEAEINSILNRKKVFL